MHREISNVMFFHFSVQSSLESLRFFGDNGTFVSETLHHSPFTSHPTSLIPHPKPLPSNCFPFRESNFQMGFQTEVRKKEKLLLEVVFHLRDFSDNLSSLRRKKMAEVKGLTIHLKTSIELGVNLIWFICTLELYSTGYLLVLFIHYPLNMNLL